MLELLVLGGVLVLTAVLIRRHKVRARDKRIAEYPFPVSVSRKVKEVYPHLADHHVEAVIAGLREFFAISATARGRVVAMPSKAVDVAWHELIVFTRSYQNFCKTVLGRFLHHTPAEAMRTPTLAQDGIKRAWRLSCARENINPQSPNRLPLLFAIDRQLETRMATGIHSIAARTATPIAPPTLAVARGAAVHPRMEMVVLAAAAVVVVGIKPFKKCA